MIVDDIAWLLSLDLSSQSTKLLEISYPNVQESDSRDLDEWAFDPPNGGGLNQPEIPANLSVTSSSPPLLTPPLYQRLPEMPAVSAPLLANIEVNAIDEAMGIGARTVSVKSFECSICQKTFSRKSRAQACECGHKGVKEYRCQGGCGDTNW